MMYLGRHTAPTSAAPHFPGGLDCFYFIPGEVLGFNAVKSPVTELKEAGNQHPAKKQASTKGQRTGFPHQAGTYSAAKVG